MRADALAHTEDLRAQAEREAAQLKLAAEQDAQNMRLSATRDVEQARAAADREVTEARRVLAVEKERLAREASENHASAMEQTGKLVQDAETRAKAADERARDIMAQATKARDAASVGHHPPARERQDRGRADPDRRERRGAEDPGRGHGRGRAADASAALRGRRAAAPARRHHGADGPAARHRLDVRADRRRSRPPTTPTTTRTAEPTTPDDELVGAGRGRPRRAEPSPPAARARPRKRRPCGRRRPIESACSIGPSHVSGRGSGTAGASLAVISSSTRSESPTHRCLAPSTRDDLGLRDGREPLARLGRSQVVVELGDERRDRLARLGPGLQVLGLGVPQRRRQQDGPATDGSRPYISVRSVPNDQPTSQMLGRSANSAYSTAAATSNRSPTAVVERALARALHAGRAAGVEPQHRDVGQRRQPVGRLAEQVAVHHAAVGGQRVQADHRGHRVALRRQCELAHQAQPVGRLQRDRVRRAGRTELPRIRSVMSLSASWPSTRCASADVRRSPRR